LGLKLLHCRSLGLGVFELFIHQRHLHTLGLIHHVMLKINRNIFVFKRCP
jgi:hypothetical protein